MPDPNDMTPQIQSTAANPSQAAQDGLSASAQPLNDLIEADRYLKSAAVNGTPPFGVRFAAIVSPGAQR